MAKAFFPGVCAGPTFPGFTYAAESGSRAVSLILDTPSSSSRTLDHIYYNGGGHFLLPSPAPDSVRILARYADRPTSSSSTSSELPIAALLTRNGKGKALLCSVHFEYPLSDPPARDALAKLADPPEKEEVERSEKAKIEWAREMLEMLGLKPPDRSKQENGTTVPDEDEDSALLLHPTHPSPIFVLPHPALPQLGSSSFASSSLSGKLTDDPIGWKSLRDANDELRISAVDRIGGGKGRSNEDDVAHFLAERRRIAPILEPQIESLSLASSSASPAPPQPPDFHSVPKVVLLPSPALPYTPRWTPLFNFNSYWSELNAARKRSGRRSGVLQDDGENGGQRVTLGDLVWYGETVTSTQTMLDRYVPQDASEYG
jgi:biotin--protein ligase